MKVKGGPLVEVVAFGLLLAVAAATFWRVFDIRPLEGDNLWVLSWADQTPVSALFRADSGLSNRWRPLPYQMIWLEYHWLSLEHVKAYFVVNLLLWTTCGWLIYRIVDLFGHSKLAGLFAAAVVLTDERSVWAMAWIVERENAMACLFGLVALWVVTRGRERSLMRVELAGVLLALLAAALSKEYGLAFAGAVVVYGLRERRLALTVAALGAGAMYAALRLGMNTGSVGSYCEDMGYFFSSRRVCYERADLMTVTQAVYNVVATGIGNLLHGTFTGQGEIDISRVRLATSGVWLVAAVLAWLKGPRAIGVTGFVVMFASLLSFMLYRDRNQLVGLCAFGIAVGVGLAIAGARLSADVRGRQIRATVVTVLLSLLALQAIQTHNTLSLVVEDMLTHDPCESQQGHPAVVRRIKVKYGMSNPDCVASQ